MKYLLLSILLTGSIFAMQPQSNDSCNIQKLALKYFVKVSVDFPDENSEKIIKHYAESLSECRRLQPIHDLLEEKIEAPLIIDPLMRPLRPKNSHRETFLSPACNAVILAYIKERADRVRREASSRNADEDKDYLMKFMRNFSSALKTSFE